MNINIKIIKSAKNKNKQKKCINYKEKIDTIMKRNEMKKSASTTTKGMSN